MNYKKLIFDFVIVEMISDWSSSNPLKRKMVECTGWLKYAASGSTFLILFFQDSTY